MAAEAKAVDWLRRAVPQAEALHPYVPGKPIERLLAERGIARAVKLASNENPDGPSPKAVEAAQRALAEAHRYPDGDAGLLKERLAAHMQARPDEILVGNGSNEVLELVIRSFAGPGDEVVYAERGFIVYALAAQAAGAVGVAVPERDGLAPDLDAMADAIGPRTKVVALANPNNPTGAFVEPDALERFFARVPEHVVILLDEAYHEYVAERQGDSWHRFAHPGLVVVRTFSKAYGLAGLRVGFAVADAGIVAVVNRFREPFNVNAPAQAAAIAALDDAEWVEAHVRRTLAERERLESWLRERGVLAGESAGNFVLMRETRAAELVGWLEAQGVIARPLGPYGMHEIVRISVGTPEENSLLLEHLARWLERRDA